MKNIKLLGVLAIGLLAASCANDDDALAPPIVPVNSTLSVNLTGLENLGADYKYEGWIVVDGAPVSTGVFTVNDSGVVSQTAFSVNTVQLAAATKFVLSIEPTVDPDPAPSNTKILAGDFSGNSASVNSNLVADFSTATGKYILATPTDANSTNEASGIWFLDNSSGSNIAGLNLPTLAAGWKYEGWAVFAGGAVSTGTFLSGGMADDNAATSPYKGTAGNGPGYPGEDYVMGTAAGETFPTDLKGKTIVISVEPDPDNSPAPFTLKPLAHMVPADAMNHTTIIMGTGPVTQLTGTVTR
ncbi:MAG: hypothetical protein COA88_12550 [Kordia sp.]|nr:MAG: hypothetical protein COA88_12550 [Kordia sp.]